MIALTKTLGLILLGGVIGYFAHQSQPAGRFAWDKDGTYALDTKTGQICVPAEAGRKNDINMPVCVDLYKHY